MKKRNLVYIAIGLIAILVMFLPREVDKNTKNEPGYNEGVRLSITTEFGENIVLDEFSNIEKHDTVMAIVDRMAEVETAYGGMFIDGINGIKTDMDAAKAWFYYVNGIAPNVGPSEYFISARDKVWLDYRTWDIPIISSVVGSFPQPFISYEQGTIIMYGSGLESTAKQLAGLLSSLGVKEVETKEYNGSFIEGTNKAVIVIGVTEQLGQSELIRRLEENNFQTGWFLNINDNSLKLIGDQDIDNGIDGFINATVANEETQRPLWVIGGTNKAHVELIVSIIVERPEELENRIAVILKERKLISIPIIRN